MKPISFKSLLGLCVALFLSVACADQKNTCETDQINEDWQAVSQNDSCSVEDRAEAYLALAGFSYYSFISETDPNVASILGLSSANWETKKGYFDRAASMVSGLQNGTQKSIYFFSSFLALYTMVTGNLDNGNPDPSSDVQPVAFDGELASSEIEGFTGSGLNTDSSGDDGTETETINYFQFRINNNPNYYIFGNQEYADYLTAYQAFLSAIPPGSLPIPDDDYIFNDLNGDGSADGFVTSSNVVFADMSGDGLVELNQIIRLKSLSNPFESSSDIETRIDAINGFSGELLTYLSNIQRAADALNVDPSEDAIQTIAQFKADLDNGAQCDTLRNNPAINLFQYFIGAFQDVSSDDYSTKNKILGSELSRLGSDASLDTAALEALFSVTDIGAKFVFLSGTDPNTYIPYWKEDSTSDIKDVLSLIEKFQFNDVTSDDEIVAFSEIMCASELMGSNN